MRKRVLVPVADGSEEIEAVCIIDVLRRAGAEVTVASVGERLQVTAARGVRIVADKLLSECLGGTYDLIVLPGGMPGAERMRDAQDLIGLLRTQLTERRTLGAICAAPAVVLQAHGLLGRRRATCHPAFAERMDPGAFSKDRVVVDAGLVTSQGPGTALEFAVRLVEVLFGKERAAAVAAPMLLAGL